MARTNKEKGVSLAKGPVAMVGLALLAYGITALLFGGHSFKTNPIDGTVNGKTWLGLEVNAWSSLLFTAAGALLLFGSPLHWGAKSLSLIVGLVLGAASVIALSDGKDVFGIFAANGPTKLAWGVASAVLLVLSLLPRVGKRKPVEERPVREPRPAPAPAPAPVRERVVEREVPVQERVVERHTVNTRTVRDNDDTGSRRVVSGDDRIESGSRRIVSGDEVDSGSRRVVSGDDVDSGSRRVVSGDSIENGSRRLDGETRLRRPDDRL